MLCTSCPFAKVQANTFQEVSPWLRYASVHTSYTFSLISSQPIGSTRRIQLRMESCSLKYLRDESSRNSPATFSDIEALTLLNG